MDVFQQNMSSVTNKKLYQSWESLEYINIFVNSYFLTGLRKKILCVFTQYYIVEAGVENYIHIKKKFYQSLEALEHVHVSVKLFFYRIQQRFIA